MAIGSTGAYWKPIYAILEGVFEIVVANAQHVKKVPGRKTGVKDAEWIAHLLCHSLPQRSLGGSELGSKSPIVPSVPKTLSKSLVAVAA